MYSVGNEQLLEQKPLALYCSRQIPLSVYQPALELVQNLMAQQITLAGGWQSSLEKEALKLRKPGSSSNIIYFLAKGIQSFKVHQSLRSDLDKGKVLIVSLWMHKERIDKQKVKDRDNLILDKLERFLFLHIGEGGNLEELFYRCLSLDKEIYILDHFSNHKWFNPELTPISEKDVEMLFN
ncbi:MAG: hypothetical protein IIB44_04530 [Candidatus Marinimicrobia bacterium]|nr:hypothetical protein [Candidatus Neomarinimicrobiota bacterium]MCH8067862.1 hypothetical protein [Candidatus Neomarinimicrobiota bacterium]